MKTTAYTPMRDYAPKASFQPKDILVIFGELFQRGYVNGLIDEALKNGFRVIYSTVGRRTSEGELRPLNEEELAEKVQPIINIPLEAGFDLEQDSQGVSPVDQLKGIKLKGWKDTHLQWDSINESLEKGRQNFLTRLDSYVEQLEKLIPTQNTNVIFAHTMAGGFPRAKIVMPLANRVFKGFDDRYASSKEFWDSEIGQFCQKSFMEVTGETFHHLIQATESLRSKIENNGGKVRYIAYGYHGTELVQENKYQWQSYSPYLQGFAKVRMEEVAREVWEKGIKATVFNVPEILTNSSSIFLGVEVALYPLLSALKKEGEYDDLAQEIFTKCNDLLSPDISISDIERITQEYLRSSVVKDSYCFENWPQHNSPDQMKMMRKTSTALINMHKDTKDLITAVLSEVVVRACGKIMLDEAWNPRQPIWWVGHDMVAKKTLEPGSL